MVNSMADGSTLARVAIAFFISVHTFGVNKEMSPSSKRDNATTLITGGEGGGGEGEGGGGEGEGGGGEGEGEGGGASGSGGWRGGGGGACGVPAGIVGGKHGGGGSDGGGGDWTHGQVRGTQSSQSSVVVEPLSMTTGVAVRFVLAS